MLPLYCRNTQSAESWWNKGGIPCTCEISIYPSSKKTDDGNRTRFARITIIYSRYINSMMTFCVNISSPFHGNSLSNSFLSLSLLSISRKVSSRSMYSPLVKLQLRAYKTPSPDPRTDRLATTMVRASIERLQKEGRSGGGVGGKYA